MGQSGIDPATQRRYVGEILRTGRDYLNQIRRDLWPYAETDLNGALLEGGDSGDGAALDLPMGVTPSARIVRLRGRGGIQRFPRCAACRQHAHSHRAFRLVNGWFPLKLIGS